MGSKTVPMLPVVDFTKEDLKRGSSTWLSTCKDVQHALEEYGCFVAVYDKVTPQLSSEVIVASQELFDLPEEAKLRNVSEMYHFGYLGKLSYMPDFESLGIENATLKEGVENFTKRIWPSGNEHFSEIMHTYAKLVSELEQIVSRMIFESYGVEKYYDSHVESTDYLLRYMTYGAPEVKEETTNKGTPPHTDRSLITILHQNQVSGLEVQTKDGVWFKVDFPPSSFIVMAGDTLLAWSNDRVRAAVHRVKIIGNKPRYSVGLFSHINGTVKIPEELVDEEHPLKFNPFDNFGLLRFSLTKEAEQAESIVKAYCGVSKETSLTK